METSFVADEVEAGLRRREAMMAAPVVAALLGLPMALVVGGVFASALGFSDSLLNFGLCTAVPGGLFGLALLVQIAFILKGNTVRVVLSKRGLRVPADGTRGVFVLSADDGFTYSPKKRILSVKSAYGRVVDVRRVTDSKEKLMLAGSRRPVTVRTKGLSGVSYRCRGFALTGPGAEDEAPLLLALEFARCWVTDPNQAVAITFAELPRATMMWETLPAFVREPTLYVSVADPDALVASIRARIKTAPKMDDPGSPDAQTLPEPPP